MRSSFVLWFDTDYFYPTQELKQYQLKMLYHPPKPSPMNVKAVAVDDQFLSKDLYPTSAVSFKEETLTENERQRPWNAPVSSMLGMLLPQRILPNGSSPLLVPSLLRKAVDLCPPPASEKSCLVFLIRHGEASHNVVEKNATKRAKQQAEAQGLSPDQVKERMEAARIAVLCDESFRDAQLTQQGRCDAEQARLTLEAILKRHGLTRPSKVLVSPLTRTLETADLIFPDHDAIHVREEVQERKTGKPCDCRQSSTSLSKRRSFQRFQMDALRDSAFLLDDSFDSDESSSDEDGEQLSRRRMNPSTRRYNSSDCANIVSDSEEEDKETLRLRTQQLFRLLDEPSVAVVTHKGYLRELERGPLGQKDAQEFENGEIRVYRIQLDSDAAVGEVQRVV